MNSMSQLSNSEPEKTAAQSNAEQRQRDIIFSPTLDWDDDDVGRWPSDTDHCFASENGKKKESLISFLSTLFAGCCQFVVR